VRFPAATAAAAALVLQGCAAALVQTNEPDAAIYVDGRRIRPDGKVPHSVGPPHTARVLVIAKDGRRARATVSRRPWLALSMAAYGIWPCLLVCWNYPSPTIVPLPPREARSSWDDAPGESGWDRAPGAAWAGEPTPPATPPATATPTATSTPAEPPPNHW
jgi:hypothetical protein